MLRRLRFYRHELVLAISIYILFLGFNSDLDLYIHTRYIVFTLILTVAAFVLAVIESQSLRRETTKIRVSLIPLLALLLVAYALPPRSLTTATFVQRSGSTATAVPGDVGGDISVSALMSGSSRSLTLKDWLRLLVINTDPAYYANRPVDISGFIDESNKDRDEFLLARFVLTCCAIDAQPISIPVAKKDWNADFQSGDWVRVRGEFGVLPESANGQIVLIPQEVQPIEEPENPYGN